MGNDVVERLEELNRTGALAKLFPEVQAMVGFGGGDSGHKDLWGHTKQVVLQTKRLPHLRWAALFHDVGKPTCFTREGGEVSFHNHEIVSARLFHQAWSRLKFMTRDEMENVRFLIRNLGHVEAYEHLWTDSGVRRLRGLVGDRLEDLLALARADITTKHAHKRDAHYRRLKELRERVEFLSDVDAIPPALPTGLGVRITQEFGVPPSQELGRIMAALKALVETGWLPRQADHQVHVDYIKNHPGEFPGVKGAP